MFISVVYALMCSFLWATTAVAGKILAQANIPALVLAFLRYSIATLCLIPFLNFKECRNLQARQLPFLFVMGLSVVLLFNGFYFTALQFTSPMTISLIGATNPVLTLLVGALVFRHVPTKQQLLSFMLGFAGAVLVITQGRSGYDIFTGSIGEFLALSSVLSQILYTFTLKRVSGNHSPVFLGAATGITGLCFLTPLVANNELIVALGHISFNQWMLLLFVGAVCTALPIVIYSIAIHNLGPAMTNLLVFSSMPIFVFIIGYFALGDKISLWQAAGGLLVLLALFVGLKIKH